jgi:hypothetical protein
MTKSWKEKLSLLDTACSTAPRYAFIDISDLFTLKGGLFQGLLLEERLQEIADLSRKHLGKGLLLGGLFSCGEGLFAFWSLTQAEEENLLKDELLALKSLSLTYYHPTGSDFSTWLADQKFTPNVLRDLFPSELVPKKIVGPELSFDMVLKRMRDLAEESVDTCPKLIFSILSSIFQRVVRDIKREDDPAVVNSALQTISNELTLYVRIKKDLIPISDRIIEELLLLQTLSRNPPLESYMENLGEVSGLRPNVYTTTSGMQAFDLILEGMVRQLPKARIALDPKLYWEFTELPFPPTRVFLSGTYVNQKTDLHFTELHHNPMLQRIGGVYPLDFILNPSDALNRENPLTLVIDTSMQRPFDDEIKEIIEKYKIAIEKGKLTLIILSSLAKYGMCGFDKFTGGMIAVYGKNQVFGKLFQEESLSPQARKFFSLFFETGEEIKQYHQVLRDNAAHFQESLKATPLIKNGIFSFQLIRDPTLSVVNLFVNKLSEWGVKMGIPVEDESQLNTSLFLLISEYLNFSAVRDQLNLCSRDSFGFLSTTFTAYSSLRISLGAEKREEIEAYANFFAKYLGEVAETIENKAHLYSWKTLLRLNSRPPLTGYIFATYPNIKNFEDFLSAFFKLLQPN